MSARCRVAAAEVFFVCAFTVAACSGGMTPVAMPAAPSQLVSLSGTWSGTSTDSQGVTVVDWILTQNGSSVAGTVRTNAPDPNDGSCNSCHRNKSGTFSGTISGNVLTMAMQFAAGANGDPTPICSATMTGTATRAASGQLGSHYTRSHTCGVPTAAPR